jgi:molybdopterin-binding protein
VVTVRSLEDDNRCLSRGQAPVFCCERESTATGKRQSNDQEIHTLRGRNQFQGIVKSVRLGEVLAEVILAVGNLEFVSAITRTSAESLKLQPRGYRQGRHQIY